MMNRDFSYLRFISLLLYMARIVLLTLFIAMMAHLYRKASAFERHCEIITPDKKHFLSDFHDIKDKVN